MKNTKKKIADSVLFSLSILLTALWFCVLFAGENYFSKILPIMLFIVYILIAAIVSGLRLLFKNKKNKKSEK